MNRHVSLRNKIYICIPRQFQAHLNTSGSDLGRWISNDNLQQQKIYWQLFNPLSQSQDRTIMTTNGKTKCTKWNQIQRSVITQNLTNQKSSSNDNLTKASHSHFPWHNKMIVTTSRNVSDPKEDHHITPLETWLQNTHQWI